MNLMNKLSFVMALILMASMGACSFKKNQNQPEPTIISEKDTSAIDKSFCKTYSTKKNYSKDEISNLSTSSSREDLCEVFKYIQTVKVENSTDLDKQIIENFASSIYTQAKKEEHRDTDFTVIADTLTEVSNKFSKIELKQIILINNKSNRHNNNLALKRFTASEVQTSFRDTDKLSLKEFSDYALAVSEKLSREEFCKDQNLSSVLTAKIISPHTIALSRMCDKPFTTAHVLNKRYYLYQPVSDEELAFFRNAIATKTLLPESKNESLEMLRAVSRAVTIKDKNLIRAISFGNFSEAQRFLSILSWCIHSKIDVTGLFKELKQSDVQEFFSFEGFRLASITPKYSDLLDLLYQHNLMPNEATTEKLLTEIYRERSGVSTNTLLSIFKFLRSNTATGFYKLNEKLRLKDIELNLLISNKEYDSSVFDSLSGPDFESTLLSLQVTTDDNIIASPSQEETGLFMKGSAYRKAFLFKILDGKEKEFLLFIDDSKTTFYISEANLQKAQLQTDIDTLKINCKASYVEITCPQIPEHALNLLKAGARAILKSTYKAF